MNPPLVISHPRSGLNFTRYIVETLTGYPTHGEEVQINSKVSQHYAFHRSHNPLTHNKCVKNASMYDENGDKRYDKLVLLLRNYRAYGPFVAHRYVSNLVAFHTYDTFPINKLVLYYEDLLASPQQYFERLFEFLGYSEMMPVALDWPLYIRSGLAHIKACKNESDHKDTLERILNSQGKSHEEIGGRNMDHLDERYRMLLGHLVYQKYLQRYEEA